MRRRIVAAHGRFSRIRQVVPMCTPIYMCNTWFLDDDDDDDDDNDEGICRARHNSPQTRCRSAKQVGLQMSSKRQRGDSCSWQSGW